MNGIPFDEINAAALAYLPSLLREWFPAGKRVGREWRVGSINGEPGESFAINMQTGKWAEFNGLGETGGDVIGLGAAKFHAGDRVRAALDLAGKLGIEIKRDKPPKRKPKAKPDAGQWISLIPPPADAGAPDAVMLSAFDMLHRYTALNGRETHFVGRIEARDGKDKQFIQLTYGELDGTPGWHKKAPNPPRPLYGLRKFTEMPEATVILCEGEKSADAAQRLFPDYACLSWFGGVRQVDHADLGPLATCSIIVWADADAPGLEAMRKLLPRLPADTQVVCTDGLPEKFDAANLEEQDCSDPLARLKARLRPGQEFRSDEPPPGDKAEGPRPLVRELPPADPFPIDALGDVLGPAALAIHNLTQAPQAICGQSVLAAATLAVQGHVDVRLPTGQTRPLSEYFLTVAQSGERKTSVDREATSSISRFETTLLEAHETRRLDYANEKFAWDKARAAAVKKLKDKSATAIKQALDQIGPPPERPQEPIIVCPEPTFEGLCKLLAISRPSLGIFSGEGGQFIGGYGMAVEAKLRTAAGMSALWDGEPVKRVRATDDNIVLMLPNRRVSMHLMAQPDVAALWFNDRLLINQGLLSRMLVSAPDSTSGTRFFREVSPDTSLRAYNDIVLEILSHPLPIAANGGGVAPRAIGFSDEARRLYIAFSDHVEARIKQGGELDPIRGLANKLAEHAARLAATLAVFSDLQAGEVKASHIKCGIALAQHYAAEALRLFQAGQVAAELLLAQRALAWICEQPDRMFSLPDLYQKGPHAIRDKATATKIIGILDDHGYLAEVKGGALIDGMRRKEVWQLAPGGTP